MSLARIQAEFLEAVLAPDGPVDPGLAVHRRTALAARVGALAAAHPVVRRLVGEAFFDAAATRFAHATPSTSGDLHAYGRGFADFLERDEHARALDYLADVARLEWAVHESRHAADGAAMDYAGLGTIDAASLGAVRLRLRPAVRLVASLHPVLAIWEANQEGRDGAPDDRPGPDRVLVRRRGFDPELVALAEHDFELLQSLERGDCLDAVAESSLARGVALDAALARLAVLEVLGGYQAPARG